MCKLSSCPGILVLVLLLAVAAGCETKSPVEPAPACTFTLSATSLSFGAEAGTQSVGVGTTSSCTWGATSDRSWMSITSGAQGTGAGTVSVAVTANANLDARTGTLTVGSQSIPVRQDGAAPPCPAQLSPVSASFTHDAASGTFTVNAAAECQWAVVSRASWITVMSGGSGAGDGTVAYLIERNRDLTDRTGTIAVGGLIFTVLQAADSPPPPACQYSVAPIEFTPCMMSTTFTATISTAQGCSWTVEPDASWITLLGASAGGGPSALSFRVSDNWDAPRLGVIKVRWPTPTAGQNLQVRQAGCTYGVSVATMTFAASGGTGRFDVVQQSDPPGCGGPTQNACQWSAMSDVPWITITTSMPQVGDNPVSFVVAPNTATAVRTGRITVRDKAVTITQAVQ